MRYVENIHSMFSAHAWTIRHDSYTHLTSRVGTRIKTQPDPVYRDARISPNHYHQYLTEPMGWEFWLPMCISSRALPSKINSIVDSMKFISAADIGSTMRRIGAAATVDNRLIITESLRGCWALYICLSCLLCFRHNVDCVLHLVGVSYQNNANGMTGQQNRRRVEHDIYCQSEWISSNRYTSIEHTDK